MGPASALFGVVVGMTELGDPNDIAIPGDTWKYRGFTFVPTEDNPYLWEARVGSAILRIKRFQSKIGGFASELLVQNTAGTIVPRFNSLESSSVRYRKVQHAVDGLVRYMVDVAQEAAYFKEALGAATDRDNLPLGTWYDRISC